MSEDLDRATSALHAYFVGDATMGETLQRVCEAALDAIPHATQAGISLVIENRPDTYVFTDPVLRAVDLPQYETGEGPCVEATTTQSTVIVPSTQSSDRFPAFASTASDHGFLSVLSLPLVAEQQAVGALSLYSTKEAAFDDAAAAHPQRFAVQAAFLLSNAQAYWDARALSENLSRAMEHRSVIEQAKGIIMGATGASADQAFNRLVEQSQHENVKLRDLATEVVRRAQR